MTSYTRDSLPPISAASRAFLEPRLPLPCHQTQIGGRGTRYPFVTLTFATSLDSQLAIAPSTQTRLSGPESKSLTHYLRSRHDAILIGVGTAIADDPSLNCRLDGVILEGQPRPIIVDPILRWDLNEQSQVVQLAKKETGKAPWIITSLTPGDIPTQKSKLLTDIGGRYITVEMRDGVGGRLDWRDIFIALQKEGVDSLMIEGGGNVINTLLQPVYLKLIHSVIVTIAPTWLGQGGVVVSPERRIEAGNPIAAVRLNSVGWLPLGQDVVMCGKIDEAK